MPIKFDIRKYSNPVFVETGTYKGASVRSAVDAGFSKVYSIEIDDELFSNAQERFHNEIADGRVVLLHGDSASLLHQVVMEVREACTFWLDAHSQDYNFENDTVGKAHCPLYHELDTISQSGRNDHTILIDDVRLIKNKNAWRGHSVTLDGVKQKLLSMNSRYQFSYDEGFIEDDVLVARV